MGVEMHVEGQERGESLLADGAQEVLLTVSQTTMLHHLNKQKPLIKYEVQ